MRTSTLGLMFGLGLLCVFAAPLAQAQTKSGVSLEKLRQKLKTEVAAPEAGWAPLPRPPENLYVRVDYDSDGRKLAAFVTPAPGDGKKHPAIVWLSGGNTSVLSDDFWQPGPKDNDQSAQSYREAGVVAMFPTLRGGHEGSGKRDYFFGEVDDVLAAAERLAQLPYVDANRIYLGGHSTGGTLALLVAESSPRFAGVIAFGPVYDIRTYGNGVPVDWRSLKNGKAEVMARSPGYWLTGIASPTWIVEGEDKPSNTRALKIMCEEKPRSSSVVCLSLPGYNHFSVLRPVNKVAAARIAAGKLELRREDFVAP